MVTDRAPTFLLVCTQAVGDAHLQDSSTDQGPMGEGARGRNQVCECPL
jgi:hypothetical protein